MSDNIPKLKREAERCTAYLIGKRVTVVRRYSKKGLLVEFSDGTRLYADAMPSGELELSIEGSRLRNMK